MVLPTQSEDYFLINQLGQSKHRVKDDFDPLYDKVHILVKFSSFLRRKMDVRHSSVRPVPVPASAQKVHVVKFIKKQNSSVFCLSNRVIQVMFKDKSEILIDQPARKIVFFDRYFTQTLSYEEAKKSGDRQFLKRLKYVRAFLAKNYKPKPGSGVKRPLPLSTL